MPITEAQRNHTEEYSEKKNFETKLFQRRSVMRVEFIRSQRTINVGAAPEIHSGNYPDNVAQLCM